MNKNTVHAQALLLNSREQLVHPTDNELLPYHDSFVLPADSNGRQLIWSSRQPDDWEILVYKQPHEWEACFFRWPVHHEHASGPSFDSVRQRAEQRIRVLEVQGLKTTKWPQTIDEGAAGSPNRLQTTARKDESRFLGCVPRKIR